MMLRTKEITGIVIEWYQLYSDVNYYNNISVEAQEGALLRKFKIMMLSGQLFQFPVVSTSTAVHCLKFAANDVEVKQVAVTGYRTSCWWQWLHFNVKSGCQTSISLLHSQGITFLPSRGYTFKIFSSELELGIFKALQQKRFHWLIIVIIIIT